MPTTDTNQPTDFSQLSVFPLPSVDSAATEQIETQLPFIQTLCEKFEAATGWEVDFQAKRPQAETATVKGQLEITDMSANVPAGKPAAHRERCDQLVDVIDQMISIIQDDHEALQQGTARLCDVVAIPFDWWNLRGAAGIRRGEVAGWGITAQEKIRLYSASVKGDCPVTNMLAGASVLANLDACTEVGASLDQTAKLARRAAGKYTENKSEVESSACIEIDPIIGSYTTSGLSAREGMLLVDVQAKTVVDLPEKCGTLMAGEVLVVGDCAAERLKQIGDLLDGEEMTSEGFATRVTKLFSGQPHLVIFRR